MLFDDFVIGQWLCMGILLTILGIILIVAGVLGVLRGQLLWGIISIVVGLVLAPGTFYGL
jgi:membrane-bound ClpP family serine protease